MTKQTYLFALFIVGLIALSFFIGSILTYYKFFPYSLIYRAQLGGVAWYEMNIGEIEDEPHKLKRGGQLGTDREPFKSFPVKMLEEWQLVTSKAGALGGYTLVCTLKHPVAYLLDMKGNVVHSWKLLPDQQQVQDQQQFEDAYLYPNGDLLVPYSIQIGDSPMVPKLIKFNKNSRIIWEYEAPVHHAVNIGEDDKIYTLIRIIKEKKPEGAEFFNTPFLDDYIVTLSPDGKELDRISIINAFLNSKYAHFLKHINVNNKKGDYTHTNTVLPLPSQLANAFPQFKPGFLLVSLRNMSVIAVIDPEKKEVVWAISGKWRRQHDAEFLPNGNILLYDNKGAKNTSRILEISLEGKIVHAYGSKQGLKFFSPHHGRQQVLDNGNLLVASATEGRLIEWNRKQGVVWELANPIFASINCMRRFTKEELLF